MVGCNWLLTFTDWWGIGPGAIDITDQSSGPFQQVASITGKGHTRSELQSPTTYMYAVWQFIQHWTIYNKKKTKMWPSSLTHYTHTCTTGIYIFHRSMYIWLSLCYVMKKKWKKKLISKEFVNFRKWKKLVDLYFSKLSWMKLDCTVYFYHMIW